MKFTRLNPGTPQFHSVCLWFSFNSHASTNIAITNSANQGATVYPQESATVPQNISWRVKTSYPWNTTIIRIIFLRMNLSRTTRIDRISQDTVEVVKLLLPELLESSIVSSRLDETGKMSHKSLPKETSHRSQSIVPKSQTPVH